MKQKLGKRKRICALILCLVLTLHIPGQHCVYGESVSSNEIVQVEVDASEESQIEQMPSEDVTEEMSVEEILLDAEGNQVEVSFAADFEVQSQWENAYNGTITLHNTSDKTIENWILSFATKDALSSFYNVTVTQEEDGYQIKNCGWNRDIAPGESVSFGFMGNFEDSICMPSEFKLLSMLQEVEDGADIKWSLGSVWADGYTGEMLITNTGEEDIEDWRLTFALQAEIVNLWNATLTSAKGDGYTVRSNSYNSVIKPGETVSFGFQVKGEWQEMPIPEVLKFEQNTVAKESYMDVERNTEEEIAQEFEALEIIYAENDNRYAVTKDVTLPSEAAWGGSVTWESSDEGLVSAQGKVTRPVESRGVTLTATIQNEELTMQKVFELWVIKQETEKPPVAVSYEELVAWNGEELEMLSSDGGETLSHLYGRFTAEKVETEQEAVNAVWSVAHWMDVNEETDSFKVYRRFSEETDTVFRLGQYYKGVRVVGGGVIISTDKEGYADYFSSCYQRYLDLDVTPVLNEEKIQEILSESYEQAVVTASELVLYEGEEEDGYRLAWELSTVLNGIGYDVVMEDATGKVLVKDDGLVEVRLVLVTNQSGNEVASAAELTHSDKMDGGKYADYEGKFIAYDPVRDIYVYDAKQTTTISGHQLAQSDDKIFEDDVVFYSLKNFAKTYDYYKAYLNRDSFDDKGGAIYVYANHRAAPKAEWSNAGYEKNNKIFLVGSGRNGGYAKGLDVLAHEFTHGVMHHVAGLDYGRKDANAIDEAYADILGGIIDAKVCEKEEWWIFGESCKEGGDRNMAVPEETKNPKVYKGEYWTESDSVPDYAHTNCTVISHAAYLMQKELGLSLDETADLWYESMRSIAERSDNNDKKQEEINYFFRIREAIHKAADKLGYTETQKASIDTVFDGVGIPDKREEFAPEKNTERYNYLIRGIVVEVDHTASYGDNKKLKNFQVTLPPEKKGIVTNLGDGKFLIQVNDEETYEIKISCEGYVTKTISVDVKEQLHYDLGYISLVPNQIDVTGRVLDSLSGKAVEGITLYLRKRYVKPYEEAIFKIKTDEDGFYEMEDLPIGEYTIQMKDERKDLEEPYEIKYFNIKVIGEEEQEEHNLYASRSSYKREFDGNIYQLYGVQMLWMDAEKFCEEQGGHLACIETMEENKFLAQWLKEEGMDYAAIGFTDRETEGLWKWIYEEKDGLFTSWNRGEPNNGLSLYPYQNYAYIYNTGKWDDGDDFLTHPFFCEWEKEEERE